MGSETIFRSREPQLMAPKSVHEPAAPPPSVTKTDDGGKCQRRQEEPTKGVPSGRARTIRAAK